MRIASQSPTELVVRDSNTWISALCASVALALILFGIVKAQPNTFAGAAFFLLCGIIGARTTAFTFDGVRRVVQWNGYKPFKRASGAIPFDDIADVTVETMSDGGDSTTYRLALITAHGNVPMAYVYTSSGDGYAALRGQILGFIRPGLAVTALPDTAINADGIPADLDSSIRSLLNQRRKIDAIKLLRSRVRIGLTEAVKRINAVDKNMKAGT
jgi:hypothetical protein